MLGTSICAVNCEGLVRAVHTLALLGLLVLTVSGPVHAAGPLGPEQSAIQTSSYGVDMFQGPVLASSRVTGLAGAYAPIAEGVDGFVVNPAAPAVRMPWSVDWFDYDLSAGITFPGSLAATDFDNDGTVGFAYNNFVFVTLGGNIQLGDWGFGFNADTQTYVLGEEARVAGAPPHLSFTLGRAHALLAYSVAHGQLTFGAGARVGLLTVDASENADGGNIQQLFSMSGAGAEAGVLWAPHPLPLRVGVSARSVVQGEPAPESPTTPNAAGDTIVGSRYVPSYAVLPWEIEAGVAILIGKRPINLPWINPRSMSRPLVQRIELARKERDGNNPVSEQELVDEEERRLEAHRAQVRRTLKARYQALPRQKLLVVASVLVSGPVDNGVGVESFLTQTVNRSGRKGSVTPRLGLELETISHWLQIRGGTYLEPSRFAQGKLRPHATGGFDLKLLNWTLFGLVDDDTYWRAGGFIDGARDYVAWGASVGVWH